MKEILLHAFDHIPHIPSQRECLDEEFDKLDKALRPEDSIYTIAKEVFEAYATDEEFRDIIETKRYAEQSGATPGRSDGARPWDESRMNTVSNWLRVTAAIIMRGLVPASTMKSDES